MQIVQSTVIVMVLLGAMVAYGPRRAVLFLFALMPFGMMAAFNLPAVGGTSMIGLDLAVVTLVLLALTYRAGLNDLLSTFAPGRPGFPLILFLGFALVATLFFPRVFAGLEVFSLGRAGNDKGIVLQPLRPANGNLAQLLRMALSIAAFAGVAALIRRHRDAGLALNCIKLATILHVGLGVIDVLTNSAGVAHLLEPIRTANYSLTLGQKTAGLNRMIGGFPEASSFGYFSLGLFGFWLSYWATDKTRNGTSAIFLALITFAVLRGTSSAAYVALMMLLTIFAFSRVASVGTGVIRVRSAAVFVSALALLPLVLTGIYANYQLVPGFADFIDRSLLNKFTSVSGVERMSWNTQALKNTFDTYLLGTGLGSVRASNWLFAALGTTGLIGTALLLAFLYRMFRAPTGGLDDLQRQVVLALKFGCTGFLMNSLVVKSTPDLEISFFAFAGLAVGLSAAGSRRRSADSMPPDGERFTLYSSRSRL